MSDLLFISAIVLGFGGSLHCVGMCGPLVISMPFNRVENKPLAILSYILAKALAYSLLGALVGTIGKGFAVLSMQQALSFSAGISIIIFAFLPGILPKIQMPSLVRKGLSDSYNNIFENPSQSRFLAFGFFNGLLPCGLVYASLAAATATGSAWMGALYMFLFGIGNAPALIAVILAKTRGSLLFRKGLSKFSLVIMLTVGTILVFRSLETTHKHGDSQHAGSAVNCTLSK